LKLVVTDDVRVSLTDLIIINEEHRLTDTIAQNFKLEGSCCHMCLSGLNRACNSDRVNTDIVIVI